MKSHSGFFARMRIGTTLGVSYVVVIVLLLISIAVSFVAVQQNAAATAEFYRRPFHVTKSALTLHGTFEQTALYLRELVNEPDAEQRAELLSSIKELANVRTEEFEFISSTFVADLDLLDKFKTANDDLVATRDRVVDVATSGDLDKARELYQTEYVPKKETAMALASDIVDTADGVASDFVDQTVTTKYQTYVILSIVAVIFIGIAVFTWRRISLAIAAPISEIEKGARRLAEGDLTTSIDYTSGNELGMLASSLNSSVASLKSYIQETDRVLTRLGDGQLNAVPRIEYAGDFSAIGASLERVTVSLRDTVERLSAAAEQVARSSAQMSDGSQIIAQGSAEQAMAIEELATSIQSITRVVGENTESVFVANNGAIEVLSSVESGNDQITKTAQIIGEIKRNSLNISQLANAIEDIAFQTNILALNASVEAARAGDAGRGFAIVAEEVRRLAAQASEASKDADGLVARTLSSVEEGDAMIEVASNNMGEAVASAESVREMMATITQTSTQQLDAIAQIRESMDRLSEVVQENSAASRESAAVSEELADQAIDLKHLLDRFSHDDQPRAESDR